MPRVKYGTIETVVNWQWPSKEIFESWRKDFFAIEETKYFDIYLTGGFLDKMNGKKEYTSDIDIILTGHANLKHIEKLIYEGTKLGIEKYQVFFDVLWVEDFLFYSHFKKGEVKKERMYIVANKWVIDGETKKYYHNAVQVSENLWEMVMEFPTQKQLQLMRTGHVHSDPVLLSKP
jgi:hypothetical protein